MLLSPWGSWALPIHYARALFFLHQTIAKPSGGNAGKIVGLVLLVLALVAALACMLRCLCQRRNSITTSNKEIPDDLNLTAATKQPSEEVLDGDDGETNNTKEIV